MLTVDVGGAALRLLPERAAFVEAEGTLLVADAHIGKAASFRRLGVPVPEHCTAGTLARLDRALASTGARRLVFLGDLLHAARGRAAGTLEAVARWRARHPALELVLVRGNHDGHAGDPPREWGVRCVDGPFALGPLALVHEPREVAGAYALAGHVHPAAVIGGRAHQRLRLPCFHFGPRCGVLPAFGEFTGMHVMPHGPADRVYVIAGGDDGPWPAPGAPGAPDTPNTPNTPNTPDRHDDSSAPGAREAASGPGSVHLLPNLHCVA